MKRDTERALEPQRRMATSARRFVTPYSVLVVVAVVFVGLASAVAFGTPPWEANDEPYHAQNVETLRTGHWYRITPRSGLESHQPPLYYLGLAGYAELIRLPSNATTPAARRTVADVLKNPGLFRHDVPQDAADTDYVRSLRMPSILFGLLTVLLTAAIARLVSRNPWTPVVAAAICAFVPKFVFVSGVINNDNLANVLGAAATFLATYIVVRPLAKRREVWVCAALGVVVGAMILAKFSTLFLLPGIALALLLAAQRHASAGARFALLAAVFTVPALAVCGWWLWLNTVWYGDPLANGAALDHFRDVAPYLVAGSGSLQAVFVNLPKNVWRNFWYSSGWNQFRWSAWWPLPLWTGLVVGLVGLARGRRDEERGALAAVWVLGLIALGGPVALFVIGAGSNASEGRVAFVSLAAIAVLCALGMQRLKLPVWARFILPAMGLIGTVIALNNDVFSFYA
jgi:4-amino-4-deoxy-L-arabinose transferase-like glycosyltransferase